MVNMFCIQLQRDIANTMVDPAIVVVEAPVDANVWKVLVEEGKEVKANETITILEAMKLEINVNSPEDVEKATVEKLLVVCFFRKTPTQHPLATFLNLISSLLC